VSHVLSAEGLTSGLYLQDLRTTLNRAEPKESRGGPINYSDADSGDLVPAVTLSTRQWAAHRRRPSICPPWARCHDDVTSHPKLTGQTPMDGYGLQCTSLA
jgi:hypothetical protein